MKALLHIIIGIFVLLNHTFIIYYKQKKDNHFSKISYIVVYQPCSRWFLKTLFLSIKKLLPNLVCRMNILRKLASLFGQFSCCLYLFHY